MYYLGVQIDFFCNLILKQIMIILKLKIVNFFI